MDDWQCVRMTNTTMAFYCHRLCFLLRTKLRHYDRFSKWIVFVRSLYSICDGKWMLETVLGSIITGIPPKSHTHTHSGRNRPFACSFTTHCPQPQRNACKIAFLWLLFRYSGVWANEQFVDAVKKKPTKNYNILDHFRCVRCMHQKCSAKFSVSTILTYENLHSRDVEREKSKKS